MRFGIDLDGVLVDMHIGFARVVNQLFPGRIPLGCEYPPEWDLTSLGLTHAEIGQVWRRIETTPNWWLSLPAIRENVGAVARHRITHPRDEIFYVTARATETTGMPLMHQSQSWLESVDIGGLGTAVIVVPPNIQKISIYDRIGVDRAIDDCPDIVALGKNKIWLLDRPWNKNDRVGMAVVSNLDEFFKG